MRHDSSGQTDPSVASPSMTEQQASYLRMLCDAAGEPYDGHLSSAEATLRIAALQEKTGREPPLILEQDQTDG
jgi:DUF3072 family protein